MLVVRARFPLGVYHALGVLRRDDGSVRPEWPPSPVRLIGALLAAAHECPSGALAAERDVLRALCAAGPPSVRTSTAVPFDKQQVRIVEARSFVAAELRGASRWASRNPSASEMKTPSARVIAHPKAEVDKGGVAIGDLPVDYLWESFEVDDDALGHFRRLALDVSFLGTSRSPVLLQVETRDLGLVGTPPTLEPIPWASAEVGSTNIRVATSDLVEGFDRAFGERRTPKENVERSGLQRPANLGRLAPYRIREAGARDAANDQVVDPLYWGTTLTVKLDQRPRGDESLPRLKLPATYVIARSIRAALMDRFDAEGTDREAPPVLHGHHGAPHLAILPLAFVGHRRADGVIHGFSFIFPSVSRLPNVAVQRARVEDVLRALLEEMAAAHEPGESTIGIHMNGRGGPVNFRLAAIDPLRETLHSLDLRAYQRPSKVWETVTPVIHSRWRAARREEGMEAQVIEDCRHCGLPAPTKIEMLRVSPVVGGGNRLLSVGHVPEEWRASIAGPPSHLRLTWSESISGPLILGRARHFGVGLFRPARPEAAELAGGVW